MIFETYKLKELINKLKQENFSSNDPDNCNYNIVDIIGQVIGFILYFIIWIFICYHAYKQNDLIWAILIVFFGLPFGFIYLVCKAIDQDFTRRSSSRK